MSDTEFEQPENLDNPLRIIIVLNSPSHPDGEMQDRLLDTIQSMEEVNDFFDEFDSKVCIPNEGHIQYEVGSDGMVVVLVDSEELMGDALKFIDGYSTVENEEQDDEERDGKKKKRV
ncbi:uncharacterized protein SPAPADRAFT_59464 [Spathaspora passalidarum NRRL Y-27907]|uniref:DUF1892 domain-containing protein n=1 Tax=Spathaspora passalidarum (strain NRRL Y-27907 / 11-Y1) TaxID=619300 RepID=G3AJY8_SPAPN|nr:uncharacterized protein SPAPADRAFT_59464 [Spathaspora passalidarum NRRL Y-27907]EGW34039.1 hypothetical protein SPAPADRAFT_59464 [Spathaspora passalidarum NRRL Y-27907]